MADEGPATKEGAPKPSNASGLKQLLTFIGVVGAGGGGFAALCYAIGFLAIRAQDEMLGLPSRTMASSALVRTGGLFFPQSLYDGLIVSFRVVAVLFALALVMWMLQQGAARRTALLAPLIRRLPSWTFFLLTHAALLAIAVPLLQDRAAMLHPMNRSLLLAAPAAQSDAATEPERPAAEPAADDKCATDRFFRYFLAGLQEKARCVSAELRSASQDAEVTRREHYGRSVFLAAVLVALLVFEFVYWRGRASSLLQWLIRPILYVLAGFLVLTLPAAYGVLGLPPISAFVQITTSSDPPVQGVLLTEISGDEPDVWVVASPDTTEEAAPDGPARNPTALTMRALRRERISEIRLFRDQRSVDLLDYARAPPTHDRAAANEGAEGTRRADFDTKR